MVKDELGGSGGNGGEGGGGGGGEIGGREGERGEERGGGQKKSEKPLSCETILLHTGSSP